MSDAPPNYYALSRGERDHLLAAAQLQGRASGQDIQRQVETLREVDRPSDTATYNALDAFREWGWMDKTEDGFDVTDAGMDVLYKARSRGPL